MGAASETRQRLLARPRRQKSTAAGSGHRWCEPRLDEKGLTLSTPANEADRTKAIAKTIGVSLDLLDRDERARFAELAVFPEDVDVPLGVVARLWRETGRLDEIDTEDLLRRLQNLSLLLSLDLDRRTLPLP